MSDRTISLVGVTFEPARTNLFKCWKKGNPVGVSLRHEPNNKHDKNAIRVVFDMKDAEYDVGYVGRDQNSDLLEIGLENLVVEFGAYKIYQQSVAGATIEVSAKKPDSHKIKATETWGDKSQYE